MVVEKPGSVQTGRRRAGQVEYCVVVDGMPNPDVHLQNYLWCLRQREAMRESDRGSVPK